MSPTFHAILWSWPFDPWLAFFLLLTAILYLRGWFILRRKSSVPWRPAQPISFLAGLAVIFLALASPLEPLATLLLQVHMAQHLLLMIAAPILLWLGEPFFPLLRGLPRTLRRHWITPFSRAKLFRTILVRLTHPLPAWVLFVVATWIWHVPQLYELALASPFWHYLQHLSFLGSGLLFWFPVIRPYPSQPAWSKWLLIPYLLLADVQNTILSAWLAFSDHVLYPHYERVPRLWDLPAIDDQANAGVLMWVPGSLAYLLPLFWIAIHQLYGSEKKLISPKKNAGFLNPSHANALLAFNKSKTAQQLKRIPLSLVQTPGVLKDPSSKWDFLRIPLLGNVLRWRYARTALQIPVLLCAGIVLYDGFFGSPVSSLNLAGVLPWIHWRGLLIFALLIVGNVFCLACPFMLPRTIARRFFPARQSWPRFLRNKWLALCLLGFFLWAYEAFSLWDSPWLTAWIVVGYFLAPLLIDGWFRGAPFCKYICPIGQFNFVNSLLSPAEIKVRSLDICQTCSTKDCIRGRDDIPGCELQLYLPRKAGNLDCTMCLDCVHACPHDNIGLLLTPPARELWHDPPRSGLGRFSNRPDVAALAMILVFGAFVNAAGMVEPVVALQMHMGAMFGLSSHLLITSVFYLLTLILLPLLLIASAAWLSSRWSGLPESTLRIAIRLAYCLIPLGFAMWLAHYGFHFFTGYQSILPPLQHLGEVAGWDYFPSLQGNMDCCAPPPDWLLRMEITFLDIGLLLSLYSLYRVCKSLTTSFRQALRLVLPWALITLLLFAMGIWILFQPMQMRGMM